MTRRNKKQKPTNTLWIFCEGQTEQRYFNGLKCYERLRINIQPRLASNSSPDSIVNKARKFLKKSGKFEKGDLICCLVDRNSNSDEQIEKAKSLAGKEILLSYSNPSFEYWILSHHSYHPSNYEQDEVYELVKEKLNIDTKKEKDLYGKTKENIEKATSNCKKIKANHEKRGTKLYSRDSNPLSLVFEIIEILDEFK